LKIECKKAEKELEKQRFFQFVVKNKQILIRNRLENFQKNKRMDLTSAKKYIYYITPPMKSQGFFKKF